MGGDFAPRNMLAGAQLALAEYPAITTLYLVGDAARLESLTTGFQALGLPVEIRAVPADDLRAAQEVFLSTSGGGVLPVTKVDDRVIGNGQPGPVTRQLVQTYWAWHKDPAYSLPIDYSA